MSAVAFVETPSVRPFADATHGWEAVVRTIHEAVGPVPVMLAGSRATGASTRDSDYDLVVVLPIARIPRALRRLAAAREKLERTLGAAVSLNPLPRYQTRRGATNLFVWKLHYEGVMLSAPRDFVFDCPDTFRVTATSAYSYLMTGVFLLLDAAGVPAPAESWSEEVVGKGVRKALLHILQLRLLRETRYAATLDEALQLTHEDATARVASAAGDPRSWFVTRDVLLGELTGLRLPAGFTRTFARNAQYASLSRLRGSNRLGALARTHPFEYELGDAAIGLLRAIDGDGHIVEGSLAEVTDRLPAWLHAPRGDWRGTRDALRREWASAHALMGL